MAVTQFEPADARRCFPCWDEPACKATFKITLEVPSKLVALSNMPVIEEKLNGNLKTVYNQESPIMSTYLVAVVVGMFDYVEDHTPYGILVRVYCQVGKAGQGKFALHVAVKTLGLYKDLHILRNILQLILMNCVLSGRNVLNIYVNRKKIATEAYGVIDPLFKSKMQLVYG